MEIVATKRVDSKIESLSVGPFITAAVTAQPSPSPAVLSIKNAVSLFYSASVDEKRRNKNDAFLR